eukprot:CAMPEP_0115142426 /NCGR_PEP_ID=MMETSP0227-20121206/60149_1 /TAXON_ID=89957 /ORGANISM="Polarella glacialis, Strain CCMP 1383" /LENGTH=130 /DNA_ID=CAMNT_0002551023 /DNA_START=136 /DNA_END=528 /DNA_ORIENTATION=+
MAMLRPLLAFLCLALLASAAELTAEEEKQEMDLHLQETFALFDANKDGLLDQAEIAKMSSDEEEHDGDEITVEEMHSQAAELVGKYDTDKDGKLSKDEMTSMMEQQDAEEVDDDDDDDDDHDDDTDDKNL